MATTKKAMQLGQLITEALAKRLPALAVSMGIDTDGNPLIQVGPGTAASDGGIIKIKPVAQPLATDVLGLAAQVFTPHVIQLGTEENYMATTDNIADSVTTATLLAMLGECLGKAAGFEWYKSAYGTAPVTGTLVAGNLKASFYLDMYNPLTNQS